MVEIIGFDEGQARLEWHWLCSALETGHTLPRAEIGDTFLYRGDDTRLARAAWSDGLGSLGKTATVFPGNPGVGKPVVNGAVSLFSDATGALEAMVDFHLVTKWKTAGDSLLAATKLARPDSRNILIVGSGTVAHALREAYGAGFPGAVFTVWSRTRDNAARLAAAYPGTLVAEDLESAVRAADIVTSATMVKEPVIKGAWLQPGQHIDLIGAYRPDMREADDLAMQRARIFVDSRATTVGHIGEIMAPLASGAIGETAIVADYYDLDGGGFARTGDSEITLFKNGGGAHLDLMAARYILGAFRQ
jgi:ornithine cyclodeaminase